LHLFYLIISENLVLLDFFTPRWHSTERTSPEASTITIKMFQIPRFCFAGILFTCSAIVSSAQAAIRSSASAQYYGKLRGHTSSDRKEAAPGEFPFFAQWGGCAATLIWEDILLTSAAVRVYIGASMSDIVGCLVSVSHSSSCLPTVRCH
jgi:hypothetical protein